MCLYIFVHVVCDVVCFRVSESDACVYLCDVHICVYLCVMPCLWVFFVTFVYVFVTVCLSMSPWCSAWIFVCGMRVCVFGALLDLWHVWIFVMLCVPA